MGASGAVPAACASSCLHFSHTWMQCLYKGNHDQIFQTTKLLQKAHYMTNPHDAYLCPGLHPPGPNPGVPNPLVKSGPSLLLNFSLQVPT